MKGRERREKESIYMYYDEEEEEEEREERDGVYLGHREASSPPVSVR